MMKLKELLKGVKAEELHADAEMEIKDICYDSRQVTPGVLFVAVSGFETDGHKYIGAAIEKGAVLIVCEKAPQEDIAYIRVESSRAALAQMSANYFGNPAKELKVIGITGTNGKTTSTYLIKHIAETAFGVKCGLIGTNQNMIGSEVLMAKHTTPESYELQKLLREMVDAGCGYVVMEVSAHALSLNRVDGMRFDIAEFTNLTQEHLDFYHTMENYLEAKKKLFKMSDFAVINLDDANAQEVITACDCPYTTFSAKKNEADIVAKNIHLKSDRVEFEVLADNGIGRVELHIPGEFSVYNALGVVAIGLRLGIALPELIKLMKSASGVKGRVEVVPTPGDYTILIDYAHSPDALENVLKTLNEFARGRVVVLFGCGGDRDPSKRPLMGAIATKLADYVVVTSDNPRTEEPMDIINDILKGMEGTDTPYTVIENRVEAIHYCIDNACENDIILLAGKGHEDYQIIGKTKYHLDEREVVREYVNI